MVKPLIMLIPPLGHDPSFYHPLVELISNQYTVLLPEYPYESNIANVKPELILETLANYFIEYLECFLSKHSDIKFIALGGVSLGATLSIRMNHLMRNKPNKLLLISPGGLRVSNARKSMIRWAMDNNSIETFLCQSLAIDGDTFEQSSFGRQFHKLSPNVEKYWNQYARESWDFGKKRMKADKFLQMINAALEVDYEKHIKSDSDNYVFIWGKSDKIFSIRMYKKFMALANDATFHLLDDIGHYSPLEDPKRIANLIHQNIKY